MPKEKLGGALQMVNIFYFMQNNLSSGFPSIQSDLHSFNTSYAHSRLHWALGHLDFMSWIWTVRGWELRMPRLNESVTQRQWDFSALLEVCAKISSASTVHWFGFLGGRNLDFILGGDRIKIFYHTEGFGLPPKGFKKNLIVRLFACGR